MYLCALNASNEAAVYLFLNNHINFLEIEKIIENEINKEEFTQVKFKSYKDNELISEYEESFFWDNPNYFIETFNQIFR